jgi:iron complex outermembrane recepter protein
LGYYFAHFSSDDAWSLGNTRWMQVGGSADLVNLNNGTLGAFAIADSGSADVNALYLADSWNVTDQLRIDAAARGETQELKFFINGAGPPAIPGESPNPHINQGRLSWTVGANYRVESDLDLYVRASDGHHFPTFDDVRSQLGQTATEDVLDRPWDVKSEEGGVKFHNRSFDADVTAFYDEVRGAVYNDVGVPPVLAGSNAYGVEFDGRWTSDFGFSLATNDVWEHSTSCCSAGDPLVNGKQAERIPNYQVRVTPTFRINMGTTTADLFATYAAIGRRFGDLQNQQPLPAYDTVTAGFIVNIGHLTLQLTGDNLFNSHGLTEGNPRSLGAAVPIYLPDVRPIFGRSVTGSVTVRF